MGINLTPLLTQMALNLVAPEKRKQLQSAIDKAKSFLDKYDGNEEEALKEAGVSEDFISKLKGNLNSPLAQTITSALGIDASQAEQAISSLTSNKDMSCPQPNSLASNKPVTAEKRNEMMNMLRKGLKKI